MNKNKKIGYIVLGAVILAGAFYGGMVYGKSRMPARGVRTAGAQSFTGNNGNFTGGRTGGTFGGLTTGQIIAKDDKSITVKLMSGGSKIIFLDSNTKISKSAAGSADDLTNGTQVSVTGGANPDGSISAESVQIRPQTVVQ